MKRLALLAILALVGAGSPLAAQTRTASIGVSAIVAEPVRVEAPAAVRLDYRQGRYLDVTTPGEVRGADGYLVDVVVSRGTVASAATGAGATSALPRDAEATRVPGADGRYRLDLRDGDLAGGEEVRVTYVVATNL